MPQIKILIHQLQKNSKVTKNDHNLNSYKYKLQVFPWNQFISSCLILIRLNVLVEDAHEGINSTDSEPSKIDGAFTFFAGVVSAVTSKDESLLPHEPLWSI